MSRIVDILVEIPKGSQNKYIWDQTRGRVRLDRVLHSSIHYPSDYGIITETLAGDGRPLDALVIVTNPTFPGCVISGKVIGCLKTVDEKGEDTKIICVPTNDPRLSKTESLNEIAPHRLKEIEYFFKAYKELEGKQVEIQGWGDVVDALTVVEKYRVKR
ncbi:MAG: inorganic diphosphatase [Bacillota bacterium]